MGPRLHIRYGTSHLKSKDGALPAIVVLVVVVVVAVVVVMVVVAV